MRLWSLHPRHLDAKGLVALWREGLLAQNVLAGKTKGYRHHPQLLRFRQTEDPLAAIGTYLHRVADEADNRAYRFDRSKLLVTCYKGIIPVTAGQLDYERQHLLSKLQQRAPNHFHRMRTILLLDPHPLFELVEGSVEPWEILPVSVPPVSEP